MTLPDFHDRRPYTHPDYPGTWHLSTVSSSHVTVRRTARDETASVRIDDWPGGWKAAETNEGASALDTTTAPAGSREIAPGIHELYDGVDAVGGGGGHGVDLVGVGSAATRSASSQHEQGSEHAR